MVVVELDATQTDEWILLNAEGTLDSDEYQAIILNAQEARALSGIF